MNKFTMLFQRKPKRLPLRKWVELEELRRKIEGLAENKQWLDVPPLIRKSVNLLGLPQKKHWFDTVANFLAGMSVNQPRIQFPILTSQEKASKKMPWEYEGRSWFFWLNLFAKHYGWSEEQVAKLDLDEAIGLYQEILVNEQLEQEFQWGLSETSWEYVKSSGKSRLRQLPRPDWMTKYAPGDVPNKIIKIKIPVSAMPVGKVISIDGT